MQPLDKALRNQLESTVKQARELAESAARASLEQLGVSEPTPFSHLNEQERELRRKLRAHGRQLGDSLSSSNQTQTMQRLIEEVAYEHWHRMLFARFLAENNLLMYPDPYDPVAVSLEECEDLATDEGAANGWELASRYAAQMLPQIFRLDSPVFGLTLPPEYQQKLEQLIAGLPLEVLTASDSLGWVYQFWQAKRKDEVNASGVKIGARELPAVTQLFTEPYMVSFLLDNALGAWWAAQTLTEHDLITAQSEDELRQKASIDGVPLKYLRFVQESDGTGNKRWTPAAGTFGAWPKQLADLKTLDPSCGSGHFLVAIFSMLVPMRMQLDNLSARDAVNAVLSENIHGLELDQRCVELAAFALALTAWKYPGTGGYRPLPELNIACSGLSVNAAKDEWKLLSLGKQNLSISLDLMHETFKDAPVLGSLINPTKGDAAKLVQWDDLSTTLNQALKTEQQQGKTQNEAAVVAQGLAKAATLLSTQYQWVITNVPYLARGKQSDVLTSYCERHYPEAKNDLATVFLDRCLDFCAPGGTSSIVLPQNWLFLTTYKKFREKLLKNHTWHLIARLGPKAFQTPMWDFNVQLISISCGNNVLELGDLFSEAESSQLIRGLDVSEPRTAAEKSEQLILSEIMSVEQAKQLGNPDSVVALEDVQSASMLYDYAVGLAGVLNGDTLRFESFFWEVIQFQDVWEFEQSTVKNAVAFGGREKVILWEGGNGQLRAFAKEAKERLHDADRRGNAAWGKWTIGISQMSHLPATLGTGEKFDTNIAIILPHEKKHVLPIWAYCSSAQYNNDVRRLSQKLNVTNASLVKVPFDIKHWSKIAKEQYPHGLPQPYTNDPTQWIFHGHPFGSVVWDEEKKWTTQGPLRTDDTVLQVAVARLLGYQWPTELIKEMELADEQREWVKRCEALLPFTDEDGIVCIPAVRGEASCSDRLLNLLAAAYGNHWSNNVLTDLLNYVGHTGKTLETWLRDKFFIQHCKLFNHRPFIWHIWDGLPDGFSALVNYQKLDRKNLETLIYTYLGDWISRQKQDITGNVDGSEERLAAAETLKKKLELILKGEAPYDIFVRWKTIEQQPVGWDPDLNDGVRLNIRPFMYVPDVKKKDAGVLREKPNTKWAKDRGKDVESAPWYHLGLQYSGKEGDRINDHHLTLAEKHAARESSE
ncbi:Eco57I restriction-modification methylase domain-containing protein [Psychrobacter immobilis]|uniref:Eco57I restriction-modification methylase domain-containing protein n=1 Tax=Psychrobacter immobilis TaxID=498 RepID=UPI0019189717|nr:N-6 DNA methylase [Psychrobacter immobilis]